MSSLAVGGNGALAVDGEEVGDGDLSGVVVAGAWTARGMRGASDGGICAAVAQLADEHHVAVAGDALLIVRNGPSGGF